MKIGFLSANMAASLLLSVACHPALAQTGWQQTFAQGTLEAAAMSVDGTKFGLYCEEGQVDKRAGVFFEAPRIGGSKEKRLVEVVVDGRHFVFATFASVSNEDTSTGKNQLMILGDALGKSRKKTFEVLIADVGMRQTFSTAGAATALQGDRPGTFITDACTKP